jgi:hypothetical protein
MNEWTKQRLDQMIADGVEENLSFDYKRADSLGKTDGKKAEVTKDVSSFANSSGGVLIYGVAEFNDDARRHVPERLDPIQRTEISKEWLDQVIQTIQPRIEGVVIQPVTISEPDNTVCYVVEVPQSHTAHMARDHRYYKRHNFNVLPMEDYEVRDVMNRRKHPKIAATIHAVRNPHGKGQILVKLTNTGSVLAKDYMVDLEVPINLGGFISVEQPAFLDERNGKYYYSFRLGPNALRMPLFPDSFVTLRRKFSTGLTVKAPDGSVLQSIEHASVVVYADEMPALRASILGEDMIRGWVEIGESRRNPERAAGVAAAGAPPSSAPSPAGT